MNTDTVLPYQIFDLCTRRVGLTAIAIFPVLIAVSFFLILAFKNYVLYPPAEFGRDVNVSAFVQAMQNKLPSAQANAQLESAGLRAEATLNADIIFAPFDAIDR